MPHAVDVHPNAYVLSRQMPSGWQIAGLGDCKDVTWVTSRMCQF